MMKDRYNWNHFIYQYNQFSSVCLLDDICPLINFDARFNFTAKIKKIFTERSEIVPTQAAAQGW